MNFLRDCKKKIVKESAKEVDDLILITDNKIPPVFYSLFPWDSLNYKPPLIDPV